jgi:hypothetical protein
VVATYANQLQNINENLCDELDYLYNTRVSSFVVSVVRSSVLKNEAGATCDGASELQDYINTRRNELSARWGGGSKCPEQPRLCKVSTQRDRLNLRHLPFTGLRPKQVNIVSRQDALERKSEVLKARTFRKWAYVEARGISGQEIRGWVWGDLLNCK